MSQQGASQEERDQILQAHEKDVQNLMNKIDADKMRMQSNLQERLKKRREEKLKAKESDVNDKLEESKRDFAEKQRSEMERGNSRLAAPCCNKAKSLLSLSLANNHS